MSLVKRILQGKQLTGETVSKICEDTNTDTLDLLNEAYILREHYSSKRVKLNMILNAKSGICSKNCGYCGQPREIRQKQQYALIPEEQIIGGAEVTHDNHIGTYCIITSGRGPSDKEVDHISNAIRTIKPQHPQLKICACLGLMNGKQTKKLKLASVDRYNHNISTSENYRDNVVTAHSYKGGADTVELMKASNTLLRSDVICGMGEPNQDIADMAFTLKGMNADSTPINFSHPIRGAKFGSIDGLTSVKCLRTVALFRLVNPTKEIRTAGGREVNLHSLQPLALKAANSIPVGDYLVAGGQPNQLGYDMINDLGFEIDYDTCEDKENENDISSTD